MTDFLNSLMLCSALLFPLTLCSLFRSKCNCTGDWKLLWPQSRILQSAYCPESQTNKQVFSVQVLCTLLQVKKPPHWTHQEGPRSSSWREFGGTPCSRILKLQYHDAWGIWKGLLLPVLHIQVTKEGKNNQASEDVSQKQFEGDHCFPPHPCSDARPHGPTRVPAGSLQGIACRGRGAQHLRIHGQAFDQISR